MKTTLNQIRAHKPCSGGWTKLLAHLGKTAADDEPLAIGTILDSNGLADALWCLRATEGCGREIRIYAVWCARQVRHLMTDPRSVAALDVAERYARGRAADAEREEAHAAAYAVAKADADAAYAAYAADADADAADADAADAAYAAYAATARAVARAAADAATAAAHAAKATAREKQANELRRVCREIEAGRDPYPEESEQ